jgi:hypothetical protein
VIPASLARFAATAVLALGIGGTALAACGGDDEPTAATTTPTTTGAAGDGDSEGTAQVEDTNEGGTVDQAPAPEAPAPTDTGSGSAPPSSGGTPPAYDPEQDSPENDIPPPPGSPAEQFEQECEQNPEICD